MKKPEHVPNCCQGVEGPCDNTPTWRKQNTAYSEEIKNWVNMCDFCFELSEAEWDYMWRSSLGI